MDVARDGGLPVYCLWDGGVGGEMWVALRKAVVVTVGSVIYE